MRTLAFVGIALASGCSTSDEAARLKQAEQARQTEQAGQTEPKLSRGGSSWTATTARAGLARAFPSQFSTAESPLGGGTNHAGTWWLARA